MSRRPLVTCVAVASLTFANALCMAPAGLTLPSIGRAPLPAMGQTAPEFVARSVAAGRPITDAAGNVWQARDGFLGGSALAGGLRQADVAGTDDDQLYRESGFQLTGYTMAVPAPGRYLVRLLMAESHFTEPGQRVFDVTAEGAPAMTGVDIVAQAGRAAAYDRYVEVEVSDGRLDLGFVKRIDNPLVAAVEVRALVVRPSRLPAVRAVAAQDPFVDVLGRTWEARQGWRGKDTLSWDLGGKDVRGTAEDRLYRPSRLESTGWGADVPDGRYRVTLHMAEGAWWQGGQRVFDVTAQGRPALSRVDIAGAVGRGAAYERSFEVDVTGGRLDLGFVAVVDRPLVAAIEAQAIPTSVGPPPPTTEPGRAPIPLGQNSSYVSRIEKAPLDPRSEAIVESLRQDVVTRYNGIAAVNAYHFNVSFRAVPADQPRVDVDFVDCQRKGYVPWDVYQGEAYFKGVPIPDDAVPAVGSDGELTVHDPSTDQLWEFWKARRNAGTGRWEACWGGRIDNLSTSLGIHSQGYGVAATGLAMAGGMISLEEVRRGSIDHALYLAVPTSQAYPEISWPALRGDGQAIDAPDVVRQGQRVRLDPSVNLDELNLTPVGRMVAQAAQKYGFIVSDTAGAVAVVTESGAREAARTGENPWKKLLGVPTYDVLRGFPWERMQVVEKDYGQP